VIQLEKHIETLLLWNDCVIVPGFGGFTASHVPARFDETDSMFIPPLRTLGFNQKLNVNDSLLAQSYTDTYDISYPEALKRIEEETCELKQHIENEGSFVLNDIGRLYLTENGGIGFTPCEAGILTPQLYSLSSFEIQKLNNTDSRTANDAVAQSPTPSAIATVNVDTATPKSSVETETEDTVDGEDEEKTISIRISVLRNMAAVIVAIMGFFLLSTPVNNSTRKVVLSQMEYGAMPRLITNNTKKAKQPSKTVAITNPNTKEDATKAPATQGTTTKTQAEQHETYFCLVLASHVTKKNAEAFAKDLVSKGYGETRVLTEKGRSTKVVYGRYTTQNEAYNALNKLHESSIFNEAWVYKAKH